MLVSRVDRVRQIGVIRAIRTGSVRVRPEITLSS